MALNYSLNAGGTSYSVVSDSCTAGAVTIPSTHNGLPVNGIGDSAFGFCTSLTSITIPNGVNVIGAFAFQGCTSLTSIIIPNSVQIIRGSAFNLCSSLTSITIPNGVIAIGVQAFYDCTSLASITIGKSVISIGNSAFGFCTSLIRVNFLGNAPSAVGITPFQGTNVNLKIYRKKFFVNRWSSTFGGKPVVLISDNVVKSGGTGKLTTKKRIFGLPNEIYLTITGCDALCTGGWCKFDGDFASYPFNRGGNDQFGLGSKRWYNDGNDIMIIYDGDEGYFNMANHWLIIDPYEQLLYFKRPSSDPNNIPTDGWQVGVETLCQNGQVIISK